MNDLETVVGLRLALLREYPEHLVYGRLRPDAEQRARPIFAAQLDTEREVIFLAEQERRPVGLLRCVETVASPLLMPERYCYVSSAYVRPEFRRQGVLQLLLERAREWCRERGLGEMRLHNVGSRESAAAAWDALGFEVVEQVRVLRLDDGVQVPADRSSMADDERGRSLGDPETPPGVRGLTPGDDTPMTQHHP